MHKIDFKQELIELITQRSPCKRISHIQYAIRCPFCGDSRKSALSTHFYIRIDLDDDTPILFNCFRCKTGGILNGEVLRALEIYDLNISSALFTYNKQVTKKLKDYRINETGLDLKVPKIDRDLKENQIKKEFIENRLGREFSYDELEMLKVIFSIGDLLVLNKIPNITCSKEKVLDLDKNYVGFLSVYNEKVIMRQVLESSYRRYENYTIDKRIMDVKKFYSIPVKIDIMSPEPIEINITEGVFDILSVFYNIHDGGHRNAIYAAATGSNFKSVINFFLKMGIVGNVRLNIFSDSDVQLEEYEYVYKKYGIWIDEINIYYNAKSKDVGVPKDQIELIKKTLSF